MSEYEYEKLIYIAAPLFTDEQRELIRRIEEMLDLREERFFSPREYGNISGEKMTPERMRRIFDMNIRMLNECDIMIAVTDDYDPGTVFEIGMMYCMRNSALGGKRIITYSDKGYGANVMIKFATFTHCTNDDELHTALNGHEVDDLTVSE
jgi:nucleoside 2-deoxyribosyltransferase